MSVITTPFQAKEKSVLQGRLEHDAILERVMAAGQENLSRELARLKKLGIIDQNGELIETCLPPDMQPGADRDFGG